MTLAALRSDWRFDIIGMRNEAQVSLPNVAWHGPLERAEALPILARADVGGTVAAVGARMLGSVTGVIIAQFFKAFEQYGKDPSKVGLWSRVSGWFGGGGKA